MRKYLFFLLITSILTVISCSEKTEYGKPNIEFTDLENDFTKWWSYHNNNIALSSSFTALDSSYEPISKEEFLKELTSGDFIPLKLESKDSSTYYQLFKLGTPADKKIRRVIKNTSSIIYNHYMMEGKKFPEFNFTDLDGEVYNNKNVRGKKVILKTWFINCKPCIEEFPVLNKLVNKYENNENLVFISLAKDSQDELKEFLSERSFNYAVIPNQEDFIRNTLKLNTYPTHFILDEKGVIEKVVNKASELILILENKQFEKSEIYNPNTPPPPPSPSTQ